MHRRNGGTLSYSAQYSGLKQFIFAFCFYLAHTPLPPSDNHTLVPPTWPTSVSLKRKHWILVCLVFMSRRLAVGSFVTTQTNAMPVSFFFLPKIFKWMSVRYEWRVEVTKALVVCCYKADEHNTIYCIFYLIIWMSFFFFFALYLWGCLTRGFETHASRSHCPSDYFDLKATLLR